MAEEMEEAVQMAGPGWHETLRRARLASARMKGAGDRPWRAAVEELLLAGETPGNPSRFDVVFFISYLLDGEGELEQTIDEVDRAAAVVGAASTELGSIRAVKARLLVSMAKVAEAGVELDAAERLLAGADPSDHLVALRLCEVVGLRLLRPPTKRRAGLLASLARSESKLEHFFLLRWYIPYLATFGERGAAIPHIRDVRVLSEGLNHPPGRADTASFSIWESALDGNPDPDSIEGSSNYLAVWRVHCVRLYRALMVRGLESISNEMDGLRDAYARLTPREIGPVAAWESLALASTGASTEAYRLQPPEQWTLQSIGTWLGAATAVALSGTKADATLWHAWVREVGETGVESSLEFPISRRRLEGMLCLRRGAPQKARKLLVDAAEWAEEARFPIEAAIARIQFAELSALAAGGSVAAWSQGIEKDVQMLTRLGIDPVPHLYAINQGLETARATNTPILSPREIHVPTVVGRGWDVQVRRRGIRAGLAHDSDACPPRIREARRVWSQKCDSRSEATWAVVATRPASVRTSHSSAAQNSEAEARRCNASRNGH